MDLTSPLPFRHQREALMPKPLEIPVTAPTRLHPETPFDMPGEQPSPSSLSTPSYSFPPRSPLPPQKLASIANALGVNTPMLNYRSPSPSGSPAFRTPSRFLLHIVPPPFLPSDDDDEGSDPEGASEVSLANYRSQFRRGTLIPLYPSLRSQLGAIAREYNLPSTGGLVLYLVHSSQNGAADGPRISDDIWKLLWHKALAAERQDAQPRPPTSLTFRSGRSTPALYNHNNREHAHTFPPAGTSPSSYPYPSPLTSSAPSSEIHLPFPDKDENVSNPDLASIASHLTPNPFLPILAKVEFDIDRRKARWYNSWAQTRRERSRWRTAPGGKLPLELSDRQDSRQKQNGFLVNPDEERREYAVLDDGDCEGERTAVDDDDDPDQATVRIPLSGDPLSDVFGSDATTWAQMRYSNKQDPALIIPPGDDREIFEGDAKLPDEEEQIVNLWNDNHRPKLRLDSSPTAHVRKGAPPPLTLVSSSLASSSPESKASSSSGMVKTPGTGLLYLEGASPLEPGSATSTAFGDSKTKRRTGIVFGDVQVKIVAEPDEMTESDRRSSQLIMKQQLDTLEKQLVQLSPRKLSSSPPPLPPMPDLKGDWNIRSAPPSADKFDFHDSPSKRSKTSRSNTSTPTGQYNNNDESPVSPGFRVDSLAPLPASVNKKSSQKQRHKRTQSSQSSSGSSLPKSQADQSNITRPAVPFKSAVSTTAPPHARRPSQSSEQVTPPHLAVQRASKSSSSIPVVSEETRALADEGQEILVLPSLTSHNGVNSPLIPLSPDPFGKLPVEDMRTSLYNNSRPPSRNNGTALPSFVPEDSQTVEATSSRFSADSEHSVVEQAAKQRRARSSSIMSVRNLRNLWRKSNAPGKASNNNGTPPPLPDLVPPPPIPGSGLARPPAISASASASVRPESQHSKTESFASQRSGVRPSMERSRRPSQSQYQQRPDSGSDPFQFDNANLYKSSSSPNLLNLNSNPGMGSGSGSGSMSGSSTKGILKGRNGSNGNTNSPSSASASSPLDGTGEARMTRPHQAGAGLRRSGSGTSTSISITNSERSAELDMSSPPSSPQHTKTHANGNAIANTRLSKHSISPSVSLENTLPPLIPNSVSIPTPSLMGLSRYPETAGSVTTSGAPDKALPAAPPSDDQDPTPRNADFDFEFVSSSGMRATPTASYTGQIAPYL